MAGTNMKFPISVTIGPATRDGEMFIEMRENYGNYGPGCADKRVIGLSFDSWQVSVSIDDLPAQIDLKGVMVSGRLRHVPDTDLARFVLDDPKEAEKALKIPIPPQDRRCGTCGTWEKYWFDSILGKMGHCRGPVPDGVEVEAGDSQGENDGKDCPCWTPRQPKDENETGKGDR